MIAPVKKSVNHSKTVTSMREMRRIHAFDSCYFTVSIFFFAVVRSLNTTINQDRWNEVPALF